MGPKIVPSRCPAFEGMIYSLHDLEMVDAASSSGCRHVTGGAFSIPGIGYISILPKCGVTLIVGIMMDDDCTIMIQGFLLPNTVTACTKHLCETRYKSKL